MPRKEKEQCCRYHHGFPVFAVLVLIFAVIWLFADLGYISADLPWFPIIVILFALGMIIKHYTKHSH